MKSLSILDILFILLAMGGCASFSNMPEFPSTIKYQYLADVRDMDGAGEQQALESIEGIVTNPEEIPLMDENVIVRCLKFEITSHIPYQIKYLGVVPTKECHGIGGFKPDDSKSLYNWINDVADWAQDRKHCFKK